MKKIALFLAVLLLLTACGGQKEEPAETDWTPAQMAQAVWDSQPALESHPLDRGDAEFIPYLRGSTQRMWRTARSSTPAASMCRKLEFFA